MLDSSSSVSERRTPAAPSPSSSTPEKTFSQENIFYLAYGSNLNRSTFIGRRQIRPLSATNVVVPELALTFDLPGIAYTEPRFANVQRRHPDEGAADTAPLLGYHDKGKWKGGLIGVVYEVTPEDYAKIISTEGGGASYSDIVVDTFTLGFKRTMIKAHTLLAPEGDLRPDAQPSKRYLELLRSGAREHDLPREYRRYLDELQEYKRTMWRQQVGKVVWDVLLMSPMIVLMSLMVALKDSNGRSPKWLIRVVRALVTAQWCVYDRIAKRVFGDGEQTVED